MKSSKTDSPTPSVTRSREEAEELLRRTEIFRQVFEHGYIGMYLISSRLELLRANRTLCEMLGYTADELEGMLLANLIHPDDLDLGQNIVSRMDDGELDHFQVERRYIRKDGTVIWTNLRGSAIRGDDGRVLCGLGVVEDITERKQAEKAVFESEARFRTLVEFATDAIVVLDVDAGRFIQCNEPATRLFKLDRDELRQVGPAQVSPPVQPDGRNSAEAARDVVAQAIAGKAPVFEWVYWDKEGTPIPCEVRLIRLPSSQRRLVRGSITSITERKEWEREAERQRQELARAEKMISLGTLVSGIAHEINNPNHFILLNLPLLRDAWRDAAPVLEEHARRDPDLRLANLPFEEMRVEIPELIDELCEGAERIKLIVSELRTYASGQDAGTDGRASVNEAVKSALRLLTNPIRKATGHFAVHYADDLPAVRGDTRRIEQVVINLIMNACQSLTDSSQAVRVRTAREARRVIVAVEDEGRGIPEAELAHITDPFFTTKRDSGGTGLGLAVSARIVAEHGSQLTFDSEVGRGTIARLALPVFDDSGHSHGDDVDQEEEP